MLCRMGIRAWTCVGAGLLAAASGTASGQQAGGESAGALEEIVVTAQKRGEREVEVPISMAVLDGAALQKQGSLSLLDVTAKVPGVNLAMDTGTRRVFIRGVGSGSNGGFEQSVGQFVDGVYHGRSVLATSMMYDVERVEVLKGPQSTFFGNNTVAGAISVISAQPTRDRGASVSALYASMDKERSLDAMVNGPLGSALSGRLAVRYYGSDGWMGNDAENGRSYPRSKGYGARGTLKWSADNSLDATLKVEVNRMDTDGALAWQMIGCPPVPEVATGPTGPACGLALALLNGFESKFDRHFSVTAGQKGWLDSDEFVLTAVKSLGSALQLTSVTAYSKYDNLALIDADESALDLIHVSDFERYHQFSQELRLASGTERPFAWMAGAYYQRGSLAKNVFINLPIATLPPPGEGPPFPSTPVPVEFDHFTQQDDLYSAFGSLSWRVSDALKLDAGARWSRVSKDARRSIDGGLNATLGFGTSGYVPLGIGPADRPSRADSGFTPSVGAQYYFTPDAVAYLKYARGWKAGGYATVSAEDSGVGFSPEKTDTYELGFKADRLANGRLRVSVAVFLSEFTDLQQSNFIGFNEQFSPVFLIQNVGKSESKGVELEFAWAATRHLTLDGGLELLDAVAKDYPNGPCGAVCPNESASHPGTQDLSGRTLPYSARASGNLGVVYDMRLGDRLGLKTDVSAFFTQRYYTMATLDPYTIQPGYYKLDARVELYGDSQRWYVALVGKNLNNAYTSQWSSDTATSPGTYFKILDRPRSVALQAGMRL